MVILLRLASRLVYDFDVYKKTDGAQVNVDFIIGCSHGDGYCLLGKHNIYMYHKYFCQAFTFNI